MTQAQFIPWRARMMLARCAGVGFGAAMVLGTMLFTVPAEAEETPDLSYPKPGQTVPMINAGEVNPGQLVDTAENSDDGHLIIDYRFRKRIARHRDLKHATLDEEDDLGKLEPDAPDSAVSTPDAADEKVNTPDAEEKPLGSLNDTWNDTGATSGASGLLWHIKRPGEAESYLFGTIHSEDPRVMDLPQPIVDAFRRSTVFVPEADIAEANVEKLRADMLLQNGNSMQSIIGAELFASVAAKLAESGLDRLSVERLQPWAAIMMLATPPKATTMFLDRTLLRSARRSGKQIVALESLDEQLDVFRQLSDEDQANLLGAAVRDRESIVARTEQLTVAWLDGDLDKLLRMSVGYTAHQPPGIAVKTSVNERLRTRLLNDRNHTMAERLISTLGDDVHFIAVGALHLPGDDGLISLLRSAGYSVNAVY